MKMRQHLNYSILFLCLALQFVVWLCSNRIKPKYVITPYPPTKTEIAALSFGDTQFLYRKLALTMQTAGDKFGHYTNLKEYDYNRLRTWFEALDALDSHSQYIPFMAAYYYSLVHNTEKAKIVADYIVSYASQDPEKHWRLLTTALYIYYKQVGNSNAEIQNIGEILTVQKNIPAWARTLSAFYLKDSGDICNAYQLITRISTQDIMQERTNTEDKFLIDILIQNIERLKNFRVHELQKCKSKG
jgi:hypothetical protein